MFYLYSFILIYLFYNSLLLFRPKYAPRIYRGILVRLPIFIFIFLIFIFCWLLIFWKTVFIQGWIQRHHPWFWRYVLGSLPLVLLLIGFLTFEATMLQFDCLCRLLAWTGRVWCVKRVVRIRQEIIGGQRKLLHWWLTRLFTQGRIDSLCLI